MHGRVYERRLLPGLGDAGPGGRVRLDALARWLQDTAYADVLDAGVAEEGGWVVRRTALRVERFPRFGEPVAVRTWCTGLGRAWAERTTTVTGEGGASVSAVALWVHVDPVSGRPRPFSGDELAVFEPSTGGRTVKARLQHPNPPDGARDAGTWRFRRTDLDLLAHVNNAAYWVVLEERLLAGGDVPGALEAEVEHRGGAATEALRLREDGERLWLVGEGDEVAASFLLRR